MKNVFSIVTSIGLTLSLISSSVAYSQTSTSYFLSKTVAVGCYGANPLMDLTKKTTLEINNGTGNLKLKSVTCEQVYPLISLAKLKPSNAKDLYFNVEKNLAVVISPENVITLFNGDGNGKFTPLAAGHVDKKSAKSINLKAESGKYSDLNIDPNEISRMLADAKAEADQKALLASIVKSKDAGFTDKEGIAGLYHIQKIVDITREPAKYGEERILRSINTIQIETDENSNNFTLHWDIENKSKNLCVFERGENLYNLGVRYWNVKHTYFAPKGFNNASIIQLEPGLMCIRNLAVRADSDELEAAITDGYIFCKDKAKLEHYLNNPSKLVELYRAQDAIEKKANKDDQMANNPLPKEGLSATNKGMRAKALKAMQDFAKKDRWSTTINAAYVTGDQWNTVFHKKTGAIIARSISCVMIEQKKDGSCDWRGFTLTQDWNGSDYNAIPYVSNYRSGLYYAVECSSASKYK